MHSLSPEGRSFHLELPSLLFIEFVNGVLFPVKIPFLHFFADNKDSDLSRIPSNTFHCFAFPF